MSSGVCLSTFEFPGGNDAATDTFLKAECQGFNICTMNSCVFMWWFDYGFVGS